MTTTLIGTLGGDPELRFTPAGIAVAQFSLAVTPRVKGDDDQWKDGETTWYRVSAWRALAENVCESLTKGSRVIVVAGKAPELREYDKRDGTKGSSLEVTADEVGPSLKWASARVVKGERRQAPQSDPWATSAPTDVPF
jgi:single-strand DNA-binding protein